MKCGRTSNQMTHRNHFFDQNNTKWMKGMKKRTFSMQYIFNWSKVTITIHLSFYIGNLRDAMKSNQELSGRCEMWPCRCWISVIRSTTLVVFNRSVTFFLHLIEVSIWFTSALAWRMLSNGEGGRGDASAYKYKESGSNWKSNTLTLSSVDVQRRPTKDDHIQMVFHKIYFSIDWMIPQIVLFILT